jgi:DNA-binding protein HU-beta
MNKRDLVAKIAVDAELTKTQAARALDAFVGAVQSSLQRGDRVTLVGFGTFAVFQRKARYVKEPRAGRPMTIAARRVPRFAPGLELKDAVGGSAEPI